MIHIVLFQPENAGNLGNIIRTAYIFKATLHLIRPYGWIGNMHYFKNHSSWMQNPKIVRATVECLEKIVIIEHNCFDDFYNSIKENDDASECLFFTKHASKTFQTYLKARPQNLKNVYLIFGSETFGLTKLNASQIQGIKIVLEPTESDKCYNLANAVAITIYAWNYYRS